MVVSVLLVPDFFNVRRNGKSSSADVTMIVPPSKRRPCYSYVKEKRKTS